jgi:hypothetical protein
MAAANRAYEAGDAEAIQRILDEYEDGAEAVKGEGIGAELIRIIRQISTAKTRVSAIEQELAALRQGEIALLKLLQFLPGQDCFEVFLDCSRG